MAMKYSAPLNDIDWDLDQIDAWCHENIGEHGFDWNWYPIQSGFGFGYCFKTEEHLVLFQLTWL